MTDNSGSSKGSTPTRRLSQATLAAVAPAIGRPSYDRSRVVTGIVHFGPGVFHRTHQASYIDKILASDPRWGICAVSLRSPDLQRALGPQGRLYTLAALGARTEMRVIGALTEILLAPKDRTAVIAHLIAPTTRAVTITVTEKGYCIGRDGELDRARTEILRDLANPEQPESLIGWLVEGLRLRRNADTPPFSVISCDNLVDNGARLKRAVVQFARERDADLASWIEDEVTFPRTMVDSIAPATDAALRAHVNASLGLEDAWPVQREDFAQWVIEGLPGAVGPQWASADVTVTQNVEAYDRAKLRLLNGAHSALAYIGLLLGYETIGDAMGDAVLVQFVRDLMRNEIAPTLEPASDIDLAAYVETILIRFRNPSLRHTLAQIAWDGSQKLPPRLIGTIFDALSAGRPLDRLAIPVAAWMRFVCLQARADRTIVDPLAEQLSKIGRACTGKAEEDMPRFLALDAIFPRRLAVNARFAEAVMQAYAGLVRIEAAGARKFPLDWSQMR